MTTNMPPPWGRGYWRLGVGDVGWPEKPLSGSPRLAVRQI